MEVKGKDKWYLLIKRWLSFISSMRWICDQIFYVQTFALEYSLFGPFELTKNADPEKCKYSTYYWIWCTWNVSLSNGIGFGKNVILFGADVSSLVHIDNKKKFILIYLSLDDAILTA